MNKIINFMSMQEVFSVSKAVKRERKCDGKKLYFLLFVLFFCVLFQTKAQAGIYQPLVNEVKDLIQKKIHNRRSYRQANDRWSRRRNASRIRPLLFLF